MKPAPTNPEVHMYQPANPLFAAVLAGGTGWIARIVWRAWRAGEQRVGHRRQMRRLRELPDYLLADIGLSRGDIFDRRPFWR